MVLDQFFIRDKVPRQFIVAGDSHVEIYRRSKKLFKKTADHENISFLDLDDPFEAVQGDLVHGETGLILNSAFYVFNILDFDTLSYSRKKLKEMVEWRLKRIYPDNIDQYTHYFYRLKHNKILSILFKVDLREKIQRWFPEKYPLIYLGNTTIEVMNHCMSARVCPDFFVEIDRRFSEVVFFKGKSPIYMRKFREGAIEDIAGEIQKTIQFVKENYSLDASTCSIVSRRRDIGELSESLEGIRQLKVTDSAPLILPG